MEIFINLVAINRDTGRVELTTTDFQVIKLTPRQARELASRLEAAARIATQ